VRLSRRQFLGTAAAFAAVPAIAAPQFDLDVAIVGGGVAGTYAAWRLQRQRPELRVRLFEASDRIGGRLHSIAFPQAPHLVVEAGGMRFLEAHRHVTGLVKQLGLTAREYPIDRDCDRVMLRGRNFSLKDVHDGKARFPYRIPQADQLPTADYFDRAVERTLPGARKMSSAEWHKRRAHYLATRNETNRALLRKGMSAEELAFTIDASGYGDWIDGESGLDELDYYFDHDDESKPFFTLVGGYQRLPLTLAQQAGAIVTTRARVASLRAEQGGTQLATVDGNGRRTALRARKVILALPRRGIERIADFPEAHRFTSLIRSVTPIPACKSLLLYQRPWWNDRGIREGRSVTDMTARQFYVLGAEDTRRPEEATNGYGVLMAYSDMATVAQWKRLVPHADASGFSALAGNSALAREVHRQATLVLGKTALKPLAARFQDWTVDPHGGGWHYYALGHDGVADAEAILKPMADRDLFVCGEAYSHAQGWVEGALERTDVVLKRWFGG
jgi:monoamine oxidase